MSGEAQFLQGGYTLNPDKYLNGDPDDDMCDWHAEVSRLIRLFEENWHLPGTQQIVTAISDVAFNGADPAIAVRGTIAQGNTMAVNQRNTEALATFGSIIPADVRK